MRSCRTTSHVQLLKALALIHPTIPRTPICSSLARLRHMVLWRGAGRSIHISFGRSHIVCARCYTLLRSRLYTRSSYTLRPTGNQTRSLDFGVGGPDLKHHRLDRLTLIQSMKSYIKLTGSPKFCGDDHDTLETRPRP